MSDVNNESARLLLVRMWNEAWEGGLWAAPWKRVLDDLSAERAALRQGPERRSIWEIVNHVCFWREHELRKLEGETISKDEINRRNFETHAEISDAAWQTARGRFQATHAAIAAVLADESKDASRIQYLIPHDSYHVGQIMTLRAMQGLDPIA